VAELLACAADRRRVHDRHELLEVLRQQPVEQRFVAILERGKADVLLQVIRLAAHVLELQGDLLIDCRDARRQQAAQRERVTLLLREGRVLVEQGARDELATALAHGPCFAAYGRPRAVQGVS